MSIKVEEKLISGIPCLIYTNNQKTKKHTVITVHGFNNDKYELSKVSLKLAKGGYEVISFDLEGHGDRPGDLYENIQSDVDFACLIFGLVEKTGHDIKLLYKTITNPEISLLGISLGGQVVNHLIKSDLEFTKSISVLGALSFVDQIVYSMEKTSEADFHSNQECELLEYVKSLDPKDVIKSKGLSGRYLFINALKDDNVPPEFTKSVYDEYLSNNETIDYYEEDEYHFLSNSMIEKVIGFIEKD